MVNANDDFDAEDPATGTPDGGTPPRQSPSGRTPAWALHETLNQQLRDVHATQPPPRGSKPAPQGRRRAVPVSRAALRFRSGLAIALVLGLYLSLRFFESFVLPTVSPYLPGADVPPWGVEASDTPLGQPPAVAPSDAYRLQPSPSAEQDFVAYDPCRPIHYVVRPDNAPVGSKGLIDEAFASVSAATGLQFINDGATEEAFSPDRESFQPDTYGRRWAPILITWATPEENPELAGDTAGLGGSSAINTPGNPYVYVTGQVQLDAPDLARALIFHGGRDRVRAVIMHELGHVVGLDHIEDPNQLMNARNSNVTDFAEGDRAGLALLGTGECVGRL